MWVEIHKGPIVIIVTITITVTEGVKEEGEFDTSVEGKGVEEEEVRKNVNCVGGIQSLTLTLTLAQCINSRIIYIYRERESV